MGVQLADKIVLVTGAAGGVGRAVAARMAAEGAKTVLLADLAPEPPLDRIATTRDVASAFAFLASDNAGYITGQNLLVDGALVAGRRVARLPEGSQP